MFIVELTVVNDQEGKDRATATISVNGALNSILPTPKQFVQWIQFCWMQARALILKATIYNSLGI